MSAVTGAPEDLDRPARPTRRPAAGALLVAGGGLFGAAAREALNEALGTRAGTFPATTLLINLTGAFLLGVLLEALARAGSDDGWRRHVRLLVGAGFLGAYTTYSTLAVETDQLVRVGHDGTAAVYAAISVVAGLAAAVAGVSFGAAVWRGRRSRAGKTR